MGSGTENRKRGCSACMEVGMSAAEDDADIDMVRRAFADIKTDKLGKHVIIYFPGVPYESE